MTLFNPLYANRITLEIWLMTATCPPSEILYKALQEKGAQDALTFIIFVMHGLNLVFFFRPSFFLAVFFFLSLCLSFGFVKRSRNRLPVEPAG